MTMARREVLVQLDDDLVEQLDRIANANDTNRSELLRRGARAILDLDRQRRTDRAVTDGYQRTPSTAGEDAAAVASLREAILEEPW